jgi:phosphoglycolate phosphatase
MKGAIVFDLDGTLIDSAPDIHAATNALLAEDGLPELGFDEVRGFIGKGVPHLVSQVLGQLGLERTGPRHSDMVRRFEARYETSVGLTRIYPGVPEALRQLAKAGHRMAICTNKPLVPTRAVLKHLDLSRFFGVIIGGDSLAVRKPDPAPLRAACAALGTQYALFVGDSEVDAETAIAAGIDLALFTQGYRKTPVGALPHAFAFDAHEALPDLVAAHQFRPPRP